MGVPGAVRRDRAPAGHADPRRRPGGPGRDRPDRRGRAGLQVGQSWFWKSVRWIHAAAFTPALMALVIGVGIQLTTAVVDRAVGDLVRRGRHRRSRRDAAPGLHVRPAGAVQAARVRRPGHQLRRGDARRACPRSAACKACSAAPAPRAQVARLPPAPTAPAAPAGSPPARTPPVPASPCLPAGSSARSAVAWVAWPPRGWEPPRRSAPPAAAVGADTSNQMGVGHNSYVPDFSNSRTGPGHSDKANVPEVRGDDLGDGAPPTPSTPAPMPALSAAAPAAGAGGGVRSVAESPPCTTRVWRRSVSPDSIVWDGVLVATSIALGCALGAAALVIGFGKTSLRERLQGALLLTLAIVSLHFTAMGAASIVRDPTVVVAKINFAAQCNGGRGRFGWSSNIGA